MANSSASPVLVWFRLDLRLADNPALHHAVVAGVPVVPVFIWSPEDEGRWAPGAAGKWWLHQSLRSLQRDLKQKGSPLVIRRGPASRVLRQLGLDTGAHAVHWNRRYEPLVHGRDTEIETALVQDGIQVRTFNSALLFEPGDVATKAGAPFRVFTPFWRACLRSDAPPEPLPEPNRLVPPVKPPQSLTLDDLGLEPTIDWAGGLRKTWQPGERGAWQRLTTFTREAIDEYHTRRDLPDVNGTARLSPHLHFGELGPRQIWHHVEGHAAGAPAGATRGRESFLRQLFWREFAHHVLHHFPNSSDEPLRPAFDRFPWENSAETLRAWQQGQTGYPFVDAAMRELWTTGWMHNRARLAVASFLVKDLLVPWQEGARWFWDTLVDADLANNSMGWQWTAGCGTDAAPYFRVFNPVTQGERFDPRGAYVRHWIPELAKLPDRFVHRPWQAPADILKKADLTLGDHYPAPLIDHQHARARALWAYETIKSR